MSVQRRPKTGKPTTGRPKWVVRYRDPSGREHSKTFTYDEYDKPEKAAKSYDSDQAMKLARGTWIDPTDEKTTVAQLVDEWVAQSHTQGTRGVREGFRANLGDLADMPVGKVRPSHVTEWVNTLRTGRKWKAGRPLSDITVDMHIGRLKTVMDRAVDDRMIDRSPVTRTIRRQSMADKMVDARQVPTVDQVKLLCRVAEAGGQVPKEMECLVAGRKSLRPSPWLATAIRLGVDTGLRVGEIAGLVWGDIDLESRTVTVSRQCINRAGSYSTLKTKRSARTVPLSPVMTRELAGMVRGDSDPVVAGHTGAGTSSKYLSQAMRLLGTVAGLDDRLYRFHGLRHLYASSLLQAGEPITTVAALLGDSVPTTSRVYAHFLPGSDLSARASISSLAGSVRDDAPVLRVVDGG